ncbi:MAG: PAS domain S-box protein [Candidatus Hodarchaeales archaeon]
METARPTTEYFQVLLDNLRDIIFTLSLDGSITSISREFEEVTGWKREEWIGKKFLEIVHPKDVPIVIDGFQQITGGRSPPAYSARVKTKAGLFLTLEAKGTPQIVNGEVVGYLGVARDITNRIKMEEIVKASELQYRTVIDSINEPLHVINRDFEIVLVNAAFLSWLKELNIEMIELFGRTVLEAFPFLGEDVIKEYEYVFNNEQPMETEEETILDGELVYTQTRKMPIYDSVKKEVVQVLTIVRDVTKSRKIEQELRKNQELLRSFMDAATDSFSVWDSNLRLIDVNETGIKSFLGNVNKKDLIGKYIEEFHPNPKDVEQYKQVLRTGNSFFSDEVVSPRFYGNMILSQKVFKVSDGLGIITTDITERSTLEQEIRENEEKFRSIFELAPIGMAIINLNLQFNEVNQVLCDMIGYSEEELRQLSLPDITQEEYVRRDLEISKKLLNDELTTYEIEKRYIKRTNDTFWGRTTISLLKDEKGSPNFYLAMIEDISVIKQKEDELKYQLLKFKIHDGNIYLVKEQSPKLSQTVLQDLIKVGYKGKIVSRTPENVYQVTMNEKFDFIHLSSKNKLEKLLSEMEKAPPKSVYLLDRLEYIFLTEGFERAVKIIYQLSEIAYFSNLVILLSIDDSSLSEREIAVLEKETLSIEPRSMARVSEEFLEILRYIFQQNNIGTNPSYSEVGEQLRVSRPTLRKRIKQLLATGYLVERKIGKTKSLELSSKGVSIFLTEV